MSDPISRLQLARQEIDRVFGPGRRPVSYRRLIELALLTRSPRRRGRAERRFARRAVQKSNHRHRRLLRARRERPRGRAGKSREEVTPSHGAFPQIARGQLATMVVSCLDLQHRVVGPARAGADHRCED